MAIDPIGTALAIAGLLAALKGALDSYLLIESLFDQDNGLKDLAIRFHVEHEEWKEWATRFNIHDKNPEECLLYYETDENRKLIDEILKRIETRLKDAQVLLDYHIRDDAQPKSFKFRNPFMKRHAGVQDLAGFQNDEEWQKNRIKWAIKNKAKFEEIVTTLKTHFENLIRRSKRVAILQPGNWNQVVLWLTRIDETSLHTRAQLLRQEGTGRWLFRRAGFENWLSGKVNDILWIHATPGAGKTILTSTIIDELYFNVRPDDAKKGIAYFYCDYSNPERQMLSNIMGSLIAQLSKQNLAFRSAVWKYFDASQGTYEAARNAEAEPLLEVLIANCAKFSRVYLILDAIDECSNQGRPSSRSQLLDCLTKIQKRGMGQIQIVVTSRPTMDIREVFSSVPNIQISSESNSADIELYVRTETETKIQEKPGWLGNEEDTRILKHQIVSRLVDKASGMFLFAKLQLDILRNCSIYQDVSAALLDLPEDLDKTWVRLLQDVDTAQPNTRNRERIRRILQWLVAAARPLKVDEIREAIAVEECQMQRNQTAEIDSETLIGLCGPLVRTNGKTDELSLAHFSLKEFLISGKLLEARNDSARRYNIRSSDANAYLAKTSLTYLSFQELSNHCQTLNELGNLRQKYRFLDYATLHGGTHLGQLEDAEPAVISRLNALFVREISRQELPGHQDEHDVSVLKMTISFCCPPIEDEYATPLRGATLCMDYPYPPERVIPLVRETAKSVVDRPNCKSWLQLFRILSDVTRQDHPANITPLYYASLHGWNAGVERILELNDGRATTSDLNHALRAAAMGDHCDIIKKLQAAGAHIGAYTVHLGSALQSAAYCGSVEAVKTLLALGALAEEAHDFHRPGGTVGSALQGAAIRGDTTLVKILLAQGANVNSNNGWLGTPLQAVLERGMEDMAMLLIQSVGFDGSITGGYYGSALRATCTSGEQLMTRILRAMLDRHAPSNQRLGPYGTLLEMASHWGFFDKVQLLLEYGAKVDQSIGQFGNAVHAGSMNGDERIVKELLDHGADPNFAGFWLGRDYASNDMPEQPEHGKTLILREGEGFVAWGHSGWDRTFFAPALKAAKQIKRDKHNKICLLFENEHTHRNGHLGNPLQAAAFRGHSGAMELLIENGADMNARNGFFGTALQAAASQGHIEAVQVLLENGADPNSAPAGHYGSALAAAVALNFSDIVEALLNGGADPLANDEHGWDARAWSTLYRRDTVNVLNETQSLMTCIAPSACSMTDKSPKLRIDNNGHEVHFQGESKPISRYGKQFELGATVIANHPIPPDQEYYFEVKIAAEGNNRVICIGLSEQDVPLFELPGHTAPSWGYRGDDGGCFSDTPKPNRPWPAGSSWGYHGDDGRCYAENIQQAHHWPKFGTGDVVGCGIEWGHDRTFFTLNGKRLEPNIPITRRRLYPALGMAAENASVHANFGEELFSYLV